MKKIRENTLTISLDDELIKKLDDAVAVFNKPRNFFIRECLKYYFDDLAEALEGRRIRNECHKKAKEPAYD